MAPKKQTLPHEGAQQRRFMDKVDLYACLHALNLDFDRVLLDLRQLERFGFPRNYHNAYVAVEETRGEANELLTRNIHELGGSRLDSLRSLTHQVVKAIPRANEALGSSRRHP